MTNKIGTQSKHNRVIATQSSLDLYLISKQESMNFGLTYTVTQYNATYSHMGLNVNKRNLDSKTHSSKHTININKIGKDSLSTSGTQSTVNKEKKFYAKPNDSTQNIEKCDFMEFLSKLCDNPEVNGILVMDSNYELKSGDVVRVGKGHYINGSKQTAIVK